MKNCQFVDFGGWHRFSNNNSRMHTRYTYRLISIFVGIVVAIVIFLWWVGQGAADIPSSTGLVVPKLQGSNAANVLIEKIQVWLNAAL